MSAPLTGGKLLTPEQSVRLAVADSEDRQRLLREIIEWMRQARLPPQKRKRKVIDVHAS